MSNIHFGDAFTTVWNWCVAFPHLFDFVFVCWCSVLCRSIFINLWCNCQSLDLSSFMKIIANRLPHKLRTKIWAVASISLNFKLHIYIKRERKRERARERTFNDTHNSIENVWCGNGIPAWFWIWGWCVLHIVHVSIFFVSFRFKSGARAVAKDWLIRKS